MANSNYSPLRQSSGGGKRNSTKTAKSAGFTEKPGFPSASLPGKSQPGDRSNGIKRLKVDPKRLGL